MRKRGEIYWDWADPSMHCRNYDERFSTELLINVQVRLSKHNQTQLFLGIYGCAGLMLLERSFAARPGETMSQAMSWGIAFARDQAKKLHKSV